MCRTYEQGHRTINALTAVSLLAVAAMGLALVPARTSAATGPDAGAAAARTASPRSATAGPQR